MFGASEEFIPDRLLGASFSPRRPIPSVPWLKPFAAAAYLAGLNCPNECKSGARWGPRSPGASTAEKDISLTATNNASTRQSDDARRGSRKGPGSHHRELAIAGQPVVFLAASRGGGLCAPVVGLRKRRYEALQRYRIFADADFRSRDRLGTTETVPAGGLRWQRRARRALDGLFYPDARLATVG